MKKLAPLFMLAAAFAACNNTNKKSTAPVPKDYSVLTLEPRKASTYTDYPATIQGEQVVEIRPMVDGYLENIYVPEGATVKKGQLLFKISNPQFEQDAITAKAAIKSAQADSATAEMDLEKVKPLVEKDIVSKYELDAAQYTLDSKVAAVRQARASLRNAEINIGYTYIYSPKDGVIGLIPYRIGALVSSSSTSPLTTLSTASFVDAYFSLSETQLLSFYNSVPGNSIADKLKHLPQAGLVLADGSVYQYKGTLQTASGLISTASGTATLKAIFPNPTGIILSGASANVRIPRDYDSALLIPQSATVQIQDKIEAYKLDDSNKVVSTIIGVTPTMDGQYYIVLDGLKAGDRVVLNGVNLKDGFQVKPRNANLDSVYEAIDTSKDNE
jgi:membrane fusion protein (multidrug efflux system)